MNKYRNKILYAVLGAMLLFQAGDWMLSNVIEGPMAERRAKRTRLEKKIKKRKQELAAARKADKELDVWRTQSLPSDTEVARSLYRAWLLDLVDQVVGFSAPHVDTGAAVSRKGIQSLSFSVRGRGTLKQLTEFLFEFYRADHLHQIQSLSITPLRRSGELDLSISIEALILPGADRKDQLSSRSSGRLASASLEDYQGIVQRDLFGVGGGFDAADHAYLTGVTQSGGQAVVWFSLRASDKTLRLRKGESFEVGQFRGTIVEIEDSDVIIESSGERWLLTVGESLIDAFALPPEF